MTDKAVATEVITPSLSKDVAFTEKVNDVDQALKSRATAQKALKLKWAAIVKILNKYDVTAPGRRGDAVVAQNLVGNLTIYEPENELLKDKDMVYLAGLYRFSDLFLEPKTRRILKKRVPGFTEVAETVQLTKEAISEGQKEDKEATKAARAELQAAVDDYIAELEAYDETVQTVANVKEYIAVVKDVAEISAIAQGVQRS